MRPLRGIIFDFDGTILDTETPEYEAWQMVCQEHGVALPVALWATGVGIGVEENPFNPYEFLANSVSYPIDTEAIRQQRRALFQERVALQKPRPGIIDLLDAAAAQDVKIGLASSSGHDWVDTHLARIGLLHYFPVRLCADDVARTKPDPELYVRCLEALRLAPDEALALEDSPNGIRAAKAAGMYCVAYPNALTRLLPGIENADRITTGATDLSLDVIVNERLPSVQPAIDARKKV